MSDSIDDRAKRADRDMVLAPNEYAFISDETKGEVNAFVGPNKTSLAAQDRPVVFDNKSKRFVPTDLRGATQVLQTAPEGWYVVLKNPAEGDKHPTGSGKLTTPTLKVGKKVNISGPASFALWPGQMAKVVQGHNLRSNEYLLVRVYDEEAAKANWSKAVIKTQTEAAGTAEPGADTTPKSKKDTKAAATAAADKASFDLKETDLTMGKLFVIRGTDVSFYIPSTGIEVVVERVNGEERYVREAVSLERLEYCLLLDQSGQKRYVHGPAVVFPQPTEKFVEASLKSSADKDKEKVKAKKFRAQELTKASGIHIRVIADYTEEDGTERKAGDELFITGKEQTIYYPREEHATIKYGEQDMHYGIAIPVGEARYVLDRETGVISLVNGPQIFLPDPREQVIAQRALPLNLCELLYPGNHEAMEINAARLGMDDQDISAGGGGENLLSAETRGYASYDASSAVATPDTTRRVMIRGASKSLPGDAFDRKNKFSAPRSIVLNTKFDGAVSTTIWTGYAMLLISKSGNRRVVQGPGTFMLEYDESPQVLTLSRGKPKNMDNPLKTVFLLTKANKVSDLVEVETKDFCRLNVKLSYRVNFEGNPESWFNVDNYVKFLCDHMRSRLRSAVQKIDVEEFYGSHTEILRDIILGKSSTAEGKATRPGQVFEENGMKIYDVEVLEVKMQNPEIEKMLVQSQRDVIQNTLLLKTERRKLSYIQESETIKRQLAETNAETQKQKLELEREAAKNRLELDLQMIQASAQTQAENQANALSAQKSASEIASIELQRRVTSRETDIVLDQKAQAVKLTMIQAEVQAIVDKAKAIQPDLIAALSAFGERAMVEKVAESMAPLSIIGGTSVIDVFKKLVEGTTLAKQLGDTLVAATNGTNGNGKTKQLNG